MFYHNLVLLVPELTKFRRVLDRSILEALIGKRKSVEDLRPDYFHYCDATRLAIHGEFDENPNHEQDLRRLKEIAHCAGIGVDRVFYFRIQAHLDTPHRALCKREVRRGMGFFVLTDEGKRFLKEVAVYLQDCIKKMNRGDLPPPLSRSGKPFIKQF